MRQANSPEAVAARTRRNVAVAGHTGDVDLARSAISDSDPRVRATALTALRRLGKLTTTDIEEALGDPAPIVRCRACELAAGDPDVDLVASLREADAAVVETAAWACGEQTPTRSSVLEGLRAVASNHEDALCREAAVASLGSIGDASSLDVILAAMSDKAPVRRRAVIALAPFEGKDVDAALAVALTDRDWQVRQAAEDLLSIGTEELPPDDGIDNR